jgi:hypothetical protein
MPMNPSKAELKDRTYRVARALLADLPLNQEVHTTDKEWGDKFGINRVVFGRHRWLFEKLGIMKMENRWGSGNGAPRMIFFTRLTDETETYRRLDKHFAEGGSWTVNEQRPDPINAHSKTAEAKRLKKIVEAKPFVISVDQAKPVEDETVAIVGDDKPEPLAALAPARKDEGLALIEAARQYRRRDQGVIEHLDAIEALGIKVDRAAALGAIELTRDERLEAVGDVLDYIDQIERENARSARWHDERKALLAENATLRGENDRLTRANRRMAESRAVQTVASRVTAQ